MDIRPALSVLKSAIDLSETVAALTRSAPQPELRSAVRALEQALAELKSHCLALQDDLAELAERLAAYDQITLEHGLYWRFIGDKKSPGRSVRNATRRSRSCSSCAITRAASASTPVPPITNARSVAAASSREPPARATTPHTGCRSLRRGWLESSLSQNSVLFLSRGRRTACSMAGSEST